MAVSVDEVEGALVVGGRLAVGADRRGPVAGLRREAEHGGRITGCRGVVGQAGRVGRRPRFQGG